MGIIEIIEEKLSTFKNLYDSIRIVDPINKNVVSFGEDNIELIEEPCFRFLKKDEYCNNCISVRSCLENDTFVKMETVEGKLFMIISSPVTIENNLYIVEMIKDISETGRTIKNEKIINNIESLLKEMNEAAVTKE
ncbi:hypothetical protein [Clostridium sp.]